ncbi:MAG: TIGR03067 domain-containing protein [Gemmataceae bacterium]|nr:TIGR03067 domain-containing protein [Gemmataceae bacterium]
MNPYGAVVLLAGALVVAGGRDDLVKRELARLQGTWQTVSVEIDGESLGPGVKKDRLTIEGNAFVLSTRGGNTGGILTIDPTRRPRTIDTETRLGDNKGTKAVGIYVIDDDTLKVCYAPVPQPRPTEFKTTPKSMRALVIYKRVKQ